MRTAGIIVAAGGAVRMRGDIPKQYRLLAGRPVIFWSIRAFSLASIAPIVIVSNPDHAALLAGATAGGPRVQTVSGGATRTDSVRAGLAALADADAECVLVHDAARPGLTPAMIAALVAELEAGADAVAPAVRVADALRRVDGAMRITEEVTRDDSVLRVQTPQAFRLSVLRAAYARADGAAFEDDLAAARAAGFEARLIPGDARLMKLTYPEDFALAEQLFSSALTPCVGSGFDAHRFGPGDHVTLCGVRIAHDKGLVGHSDADAGWHALVDALLGALGQGDIGAHFPPSDAQWKGAPSALFLQHAAKLVEQAGARIAHVDITLICERPKIGPHRAAMRARTAEVLGLPLDRVSVKATTTERLGFLGREEGLAAQAMATVQRPL